MDTCRNCGLKLTCLHKLKDRHLSRSVLHNDAIDIEPEKALAAFERLGLRFRKMSVDNLFRQCQWASEPATNGLEGFFRALIDSADHLRCRFNSHRSRIRANLIHGYGFRRDLERVADYGEAHSI